MFFGSKKIPELAKGLGKAMREVKDASNEIKKEIRDSATSIKDDFELSDVLKINAGLRYSSFQHAGDITFLNYLKNCKNIMAVIRECVLHVASNVLLYFCENFFSKISDRKVRLIF